MTGTDAIRAAVDELLGVLSTRNIIGEPMEMGDKIIIPITKMGMGFSASQGKESRGNEISKMKAGGGAGVMPVAIVVVFKEIPGEEGVKVIPLSGRSSDKLYIGGIAGATQSILERIAASRERSEKESAEKESTEKESAEKEKAKKERTEKERGDKRSSQETAILIE